MAAAKKTPGRRKSPHPKTPVRASSRPDEQAGRHPQGAFRGGRGGHGSGQQTEGKRGQAAATAEEAGDTSLPKPGGESTRRPRAESRRERKTTPERGAPRRRR